MGRETVTLTERQGKRDPRTNPAVLGMVLPASRRGVNKQSIISRCIESGAISLDKPTVQV